MISALPGLVLAGPLSSGNAPPQILGLGAFPDPRVAGTALQISAGVTDDQKRDLTYTFYFGDGQSFSGSAPPGDIWTSDSYALPRTYMLTFEVTDAQGATSAQATDLQVVDAQILRVSTSIDSHPDRGVPARIYLSDRITGTYRNTWGIDWMRTLITGVYPPYNYVSFSDVPGYVTPRPQSCSVSPTQPQYQDCDGIYAAEGWLRVSTNPPLPATIYVDGVARNDWGMWTSLPSGSYTVSFGTVQDYTAPPPQTVTVLAEQQTTIIGDYTWNSTSPGPDPASFGTLRVVTKLDTGTVGVPTQIEIDGVARDTWGLNWLKLAPGCYTISFTDVPGLGTPAPVTACVTAGQVREVTATFTVMGWLRVILSPSLPATISVNWAPFNAWGVWTSLTPGTYVVAFGQADGYREPAAQTVTVTAGQTTVVMGDYVPA